MLFKFKDIEPAVDPEAFVAETAAVIGDVTIAKDCSVWFGASVRGDCAPITVGEGTNIQDNATLHCEVGHPLTVGKNVTIGHNALVHCSEVGDGSLVGMGARLLDGAVIGKNCVIGAGAVVKEYTVVPDRTLMVGVPARAVRELSEEQLRKLQNAQVYVALSKEYLK